MVWRLGHCRLARVRTNGGGGKLHCSSQTPVSSVLSPLPTTAARLEQCWSLALVILLCQAATVCCVDTIDSVDRVDSVDSVDSVDTVDTVDNMDTVDTMGTVDSADTVDTVDNF